MNSPRVTVELPEHRYDTIRAFRQEICRTVGLDPEGPAADPLPYATYLFVYPPAGRVGEVSEPAGMVEFFLYDQAFDSYESAPYSEAANLAELAPMGQMAHLRSVILAEQYRKTRLFQYLLMAMALTAFRMGARFMTAGTGLHNHSILALHQGAGMRRLGFWTPENCAPQQLSLLELEPLAQRVAAMKQLRFFEFEPERLRALRNRRAA